MKKIVFVLLSFSLVSSSFAHPGIWGEDVYPEDNAQHLGYGFRKIPVTDYFYDEAFVEGNVGKTVTNFMIEENLGGLGIDVMFGDTSFTALAWAGQKILTFKNGDGDLLKLKYKRPLGVLFPETFESQVKTALGIAS